MDARNDAKNVIGDTPSSGSDGVLALLVETSTKIEAKRRFARFDMFPFETEIDF